MSSAPSILILGATGYIGGTVLVDLLKTQSPKTITALVRDNEKAALLSPLGINVIIGDREDVPLLKSLVVDSDIVLNFAVPFGGGDASIQALVDGLEERAATSHIKPVLLQTSGSGSILYGEGGIAGTDVWSDEMYERWNALPDAAYFHTGDKIIAKAALDGKISAFIVMSPTVYGPGTGPGNKLSLQVPSYVAYAKKHGQAAYIGKGENIWGNVHVQDLSDLYLLLINHSLQNPDATVATPSSHGYSNLIYTGLNTHAWGPVVSTLGDLLYARGMVKQAGAKSIPDSEGEGYMFGGNSFMKVSEKARQLGWSQKQKGFVDQMKEALAVPVQTQPQPQQKLSSNRWQKLTTVARKLVGLKNRRL